MKIQKKNIFWWGGPGGRVGVRVNMNEELKFLGKFTKRNSGGGRFRGGGGVRVVGVREDVNEELKFL